MLTNVVVVEKGIHHVVVYAWVFRILQLSDFGIAHSISVLESMSLMTTKNNHDGF